MSKRTGLIFVFTAVVILLALLYLVLPEPSRAAILESAKTVLMWLWGIATLLSLFLVPYISGMLLYNPAAKWFDKIVDNNEEMSLVDHVVFAICTTVLLGILEMPLVLGVTKVSKIAAAVFKALFDWSGHWEILPLGWWVFGTCVLLTGYFSIYEYCRRKDLHKPKWSR